MNNIQKTRLTLYLLCLSISLIGQSSPNSKYASLSGVASHFSEEDISFKFSAIPLFSPLRIGDQYVIDVETCNTGTTDLFNLEVKSFFDRGIIENEAGNTKFDLPADSCIVSFYGYIIWKDFIEMEIEHDYILYLNERKISSLNLTLDADLSDLITEPTSDLPYLELYPWLSGRISDEDCPNLEITEYDFGRYKIIYFSDGRLFLSDGRLECQSTETFSCIGFNRYSNDKISNKWNCIDGSQIEIEEIIIETVSSNIYPWLDSELSSSDCSSLSITEYDRGAFSFVYISDGRLFFEDGTFWCQDSEIRDCRALYGLHSSQIKNFLSCDEGDEQGSQNENESEVENESEEENENALPIEEYPWITQAITSFDCGSLSIQEYNLGAFSFLFLQDADQGFLYFEDGTFYCRNSETMDCLALYNLGVSDISNTWNCGDDQSDDENENTNESTTDLFSEYSWISTIISPTCTTGSIQVYVDGIFRFFLIDNGNESALYFQDGTFYCAQTESYNCVSLYGLTDLVADYTCTGFINTQSETRDFPSFDDQELSLYPNPTHDKFQIAYAGIISDISVMDISGRKILTRIDENLDQGEITIDLSQQESGLFIIHMNLNGTDISKKMVKF